jgi:hypothetical protein
LSAISRKITRDQLTELIAFGVVLRQRGFEEFETHVHTEALLKALREWKDEGK